MLAWSVEIKKTEKNGGTVVSRWITVPTYGEIHENLIELKEKGKALCIHDGGGYPYIYSAKTTDVMPFIKKELNASRRFFNYDADISAETTKDIQDIPCCSPDETLIITLWDQS